MSGWLYQYILQCLHCVECRMVELLLMLSCWSMLICVNDCEALNQLRGKCCGKPVCHSLVGNFRQGVGDVIDNCDG